MDELINFIQSCGFPIVCCFVLFWQNNKYQKSLGELTDAINKMSNLIKTIEKRLDKLDAEKGKVVR